MNAGPDCTILYDESTGDSLGYVKTTQMTKVCFDDGASFCKMTCIYVPMNPVVRKPSSKKHSTKYRKKNRVIKETVD